MEVILLWRGNMDIKTAKLSGNQLKILALLCMTLDHIGLILLPQYTFLRVIGRLAFPIFAWMIAEGCRYTRSMRKYLAAIAVVGILYQLEFWLLIRSLKMNIMLTFALSAGLCWLLRTAREKGSKLLTVLVLMYLVAVYVLTDILPLFVPRGYGIDYGFYGVLLPVAIYFAREKKWQLLVSGLLLILLTLWSGWAVQWASLLALPLLAMYSGRRGKGKLKWLFYVYYPAHLTVLWALLFLIRK